MQALSHSKNRTRRASEAITLSDVARHAGVKPMTVSRALNGGNVSEGLRKTVLKSVQELGYRPNLAARSVASQKSMLIGTLAQNGPKNSMTHPLVWTFLLGINNGLAHSGYTTVLVRLTDVAEDEGLSAPVFEGHLLDGLIVVNSLASELETRIEELVPRCIWLDANVWRDTNCIRRDESGAGRMTTQKLLECRPSRVVLAVGAGDDREHFSRALRRAAVRETARNAGVEIEEFKMPNVYQLGDPQWQIVSDFCASLDPQTGVIAENIYVAENLLQMCARAGKRPGLDFSLCSIDEGKGGSMVWPQLSCVEFDRYDYGERAAQMMLELLRNPENPPASQFLPCRWHAGETLIQPSL